MSAAQRDWRMPGSVRAGAAAGGVAQAYGFMPLKTKTGHWKNQAGPPRSETGQRRPLNGNKGGPSTELRTVKGPLFKVKSGGRGEHKPRVRSTAPIADATITSGLFGYGSIVLKKAAVATQRDQ